MKILNLYRIKHKPTGLYYVPGPYSNLNWKGKIYTGGNNVINWANGLSSNVNLKILNRNTLLENMNILADPKKSKGEMKAYLEFPEGKAKMKWVCSAPVEDFEMETVFLKMI